MTIQEIAIRAVNVVTETSDAVAMTHETSRESPLRRDRKYSKPRGRTRVMRMIVMIFTMTTTIMITMMDGMPMNGDIQTKKEKNTKTLLMKMTLWQQPMKWKRTKRTLDRTFESRRPNGREVLTETIDSSSKTTLIGSRDDIMVPAEGAAICRTRLTFVEDDASSASKSTNPVVYQELTKLVRTKVDKKDIAPELQTLLFGSPSTLTGLFQNGLPQLAEPAIEAECVYAFKMDLRDVTPTVERILGGVPKTHLE
ncbi:LOW QUALITY PROTEIN: hypothetical protein PHMEG_00020897 [Phytophthora megakarya]|uniref:Uncharacterized protein n=1 Tax=Phytophthora megakarya TaxID=4795 RepID=A0A225VN11_9STRA|nr:LOW QUALITY PROTEIN: hypothetical protein PHMEG_00020897 [Phytophthora megakarya]